MPKLNIFLKFLLGILAITLFSNFLLLLILRSGYEEVLAQIRPLLGEILAEQEIHIINTWLIVGATILFILSLVFFFTIVFTDKIVTPLKTILEGTKEVGKGKVETKIDIKTGDELEELAKEFNKMTFQLKKAQEALEAEKVSLQIKVRARTESLEELAQSLEERVKERTRDLAQKSEELEKRVKELEKFHRLVVGRELKMVELKKGVKELKEKLKEK